MTGTRGGWLVVTLAVQACFVPFPDRAHQARVLRLGSGDSVLVTRPTAISVDGAPKMLVASFGPFVPLSDTTNVRRLAIELHATFLPQLDSTEADLFMLQATPTSPRDFLRLFSLDLRSFTFSKVADGHWCLLDEAYEIAEPPQTSSCRVEE